MDKVYVVVVKYSPTLQVDCWNNSTQGSSMDQYVAKKQRWRWRDAEIAIEINRKRERKKKPAVLHVKQ